MSLTLAFLTADAAHIGKASKIAFSDQTLMELFVEGLLERSKLRFMIKRDEFRDIEAWEGLEFDASGSVTAIQWPHLGLIGTLNFEYLPMNLTKFHVEFSSNLRGEFDFRHFPATVTDISMTLNKFTGSVAFADAPHSLESFLASNNALSGTIDLCRLPPQIVEVYLNINSLTGSLDLTALPATLEELALRSNGFFGTIDFRFLPERIGFINLEENKLSGVVRVNKIPGTLRFACLGGNSIEGLVDDNGNSITSQFIAI